jgi:hypothetical protein
VREISLAGISSRALAPHSRTVCLHSWRRRIGLRLDRLGPAPGTGTGLLSQAAGHKFAFRADSSPARGRLARARPTTSSTRYLRAAAMARYACARKSHDDPRPRRRRSSEHSPATAPGTRFGALAESVRNSSERARRPMVRRGRPRPRRLVQREGRRVPAWQCRDDPQRRSRLKGLIGSPRPEGGQIVAGTIARPGSAAEMGSTF